MTARHHTAPGTTHTPTVRKGVGGRPVPRAQVGLTWQDLVAPAQEPKEPEDLTPREGDVRYTGSRAERRARMIAALSAHRRQRRSTASFRLAISLSQNPSKARRSPASVEA